MLRIIVGIIVGFIVMAVMVMATFGITILAMGGLDRTLQDNSWWTTNTFNIIVLIGGTVGAVIGGLVCGLITRNSKAAFAMAAIVLVFGIGGAVMNMNKPDPPARTEPATFEGIKSHGKEPTWFAFSKVVLAAIGVLIGAAMVKTRPPSGS